MVTFVRFLRGAPGLGAKVGGFCWGVFCLVLLLALRCNAATAKVGEFALFGGRVEVEFGWKIELLQNGGRTLLWGLGEGMRGGLLAGVGEGGGCGLWTGDGLRSGPYDVAKAPLGALGHGSKITSTFEEPSAKNYAKGVLHRSPGFALGTPGRTLGKKYLQKNLR